MLDLITSPSTRGAICFHDFEPTQESFRDAVIDGLSRARRAIPCRFLYDARGSALFDEICELPEYYPTRTELWILRQYAAEIAGRIGAGAQLIELGSGASVKVRVLLSALETPAAYVPIDISGGHLRAAAELIAESYPDLAVHAVCADYSKAFDLPALPGAGRRVGFYPGSTIGNFTLAEARVFLAAWARRLGPGAGMLIGVDLKKDAAILNAAYDDAAGVTAQFSKNLLARANRELEADFQVDQFAHQAVYNASLGCVEIHLRSLVNQAVTVAGQRFDFAVGDLIHIEDSYKYDLTDFAALARSAGFEPQAVWTDPKGLFSVHYLAREASALTVS
ncbi:L-histidine N(alpha)-methyltransferase [soil metagenome]